MLKLICNRDELNIAVSIASRSVALRSTNETLQGLFLEAKNNSIRLIGSDNEMSIEVNFPAEIIKEGKIVLRSPVFGEIIKKLPNYNDIYIEVNQDYSLKLRSGKIVYNLSCMNPEEYPELEDFNPTNSLKIEQSLVKKMISSTLFCVSTDESRQNFCCVHFKNRENALDAVALDGFRMAIQKYRFPNSEVCPEISLLIPSRASKELLNLLEDEGEIEIYSSSRFILFKTDKVQLKSHLIAKDFVDYSTFLPKSYQSEVILSRKDLLDTCERASIVGNAADKKDRRHPITLQVVDGETLNVSSLSTIGNFEDIIPVAHNGEKVDININPNLLIDVLKTITDETIRILFNGVHGPCMIRPVEGDEYLYMILPIRR